MSGAHDASANAAQIQYWNTAAGETWAQLQEQLDRQIAPLGREALRVLAAARSERVLDVGCGCGDTTLDLAARVGTEGRVVGIDISTPMLEVARRRPRPEPAACPEFRQADAQVADLGEAAFDAAFSRFGVMFFGDPVSAFKNIRASLQPHGRLGFVCWRALGENAWMQVPLDAAAPLLPPATPSDPFAPGPFAFADAGRVRSILRDAGFDPATLEPFDTLIGGNDLDQAVKLALRVGPLAAALRENPMLQPRVADAVREALARHATPRGVLLNAAVWIVSARAP